MEKVKVMCEVVTRYGLLSDEDIPENAIQCGAKTYYVREKAEVEVTSLHLNAGTMRITYQYDSYGEIKKSSANVPFDAFFEKYKIVEFNKV